MAAIWGRHFRSMLGDRAHNAAVSDAADALVRRYRAARRDPRLAVLEGFHALKHALRFGAEVLEAVAAEPRELEELAAELAPDLAGSLAERADAGRPPRSWPSWSRRRRAPASSRSPAAPRSTSAAVLADARPAPLVLLEDPRTMGNMGACVRVAAAADAAGRPHHREQRPLAPRRAARRRRPPFRPARRRRSRRCPRATGRWSRSTPAGRTCARPSCPPRAILAFGTERHGLSERAARPRRRPPRHPDARRRLQPQPRHRGRRGAVLRSGSESRTSTADSPRPHRRKDSPLAVSPISTSAKLLLVAFEVFFFVIWIWILITILTDLFRDHEMSGWAKAAWVLFLVFIPFLTALIYLIARGSGMRDRTIKAQAEAKQHFDAYVREQAHSLAGRRTAQAQRPEGKGRALERGVRARRRRSCSPEDPGASRP